MVILLYDLYRFIKEEADLASKGLPKVEKEKTETEKTAPSKVDFPSPCHPVVLFWPTVLYFLFTPPALSPKRSLS